MDWKLIREAVTKYRHQFAPDHILETRMRVYSPLIISRAQQYEQLTYALEEIEKEIQKEREK